MNYRIVASLLLLASSLLHSMQHDVAAWDPTSPYFGSQAHKAWLEKISAEKARLTDLVMKVAKKDRHVTNNPSIFHGSLQALENARNPAGDTKILEMHDGFWILQAQDFKFVLLNLPYEDRQKNLAALVQEDIDPKNIVDLGNPFDDGRGYWAERLGNTVYLRKMAVVLHQPALVGLISIGNNEYWGTTAPLLVDPLRKSMFDLADANPQSPILAHKLCAGIPDSKIFLLPAEILGEYAILLSSLLTQENPIELRALVRKLRLHQLLIRWGHKPLQQPDGSETIEFVDQGDPSDDGSGYVITKSDGGVPQVQRKKS